MLGDDLARQQKRAEAAAAAATAMKDVAARLHEMQEEAEELADEVNGAASQLGGEVGEQAAAVATMTRDALEPVARAAAEAAVRAADSAQASTHAASLQEYEQVVQRMEVEGATTPESGEPQSPLPLEGRSRVDLPGSGMRGTPGQQLLLGTCMCVLPCIYRQHEAHNLCLRGCRPSCALRCPQAGIQADPGAAGALPRHTL